MKMRVSAPVLVIVCLWMATLAQANSINWTINAALDDGATVTGSFVFDPDLGTDQSITDFNINISAPLPGTLREPGDGGLPTSVFFPFDFTPANSSAGGPVTGNDGAFEFSSNAFFTNPLTGLPPEHLVFQFVPVSPLTDTSSTTIDNGNIALNDGHSVECFNCDPYVCFTGATSSLCVPSTPTPEPPSYALILSAIGVAIGAVVLGRARVGAS